MARLPEVQALRTTPRDTRAVAQVSAGAAASVGNAVAGFGGKVADIGFQLQDQENTAAAKERDAYLSDQIRNILYNPETGFTNLQGRDAIGARDRVFEQLKQLRDTATKDLTRSAALKLETRLASRIDSAEQTIDTHSGAERQRWLDGASEARITAAEQDALAGAVDFNAAFGVVAEEVTQRAIREGWDPAKLDVELASAKSKMVSGQVIKLASSDPEQALDLIEKNQGSMLASEYLSLREKIKPIANEYKGRRLGRNAALGLGNMSTAMNTAAQGIGLTEAQGAEAIKSYLADGGVNLDPKTTAWCAAYVNATLSKAGINGTGSNMARSFLNWGVEVSEPNTGDLVVLSRGTNPAEGHVGFFDGYDENGNVRILGGNQSDSVSVATYDASRVLGFRRAQGSTNDPGAAMAEIMAIEDPDVRKAALAEYNLHAKLSENQAKMQIKEATNVAFQYVEAGSDPADLPFDVKTALGMDAMSSLRTYYAKTLDGPVQTDPQTYVDLMQMQANSPDEFRSLNMVTYVDRLSQSDFKKFAAAQTEQPSSQARVASSTLMTVAKRQMEAAGIDTTPKFGTDAAKQSASMQARLLKWQDDFVAENNRVPSHTEIDARIGEELLPVVLNPPGLRFDQEGFVFDSPDVDPELLARTGLTIGEVEVPPAVIEEQIAQMAASGVEITSDALVQRIAALMEGF